MGGGGGHDEGHGVGQADVLGGQDHEPAGDEAGVLACLDHASQPIQAGIRIRASDRLDEGGDDVVVIVLAVAEDARLPGPLDVLQGQIAALV